MPKLNEDVFLRWLKQEVKPALGCTEPVAIAFAAAMACRYLNEPCVSIRGFISENLYKNAMGVTIPGTHYAGIAMAAAVGVFGGNPDQGLETLKGLTDAQTEQAKEMVSQGRVNITAQDTPDFIHIDLTATGAVNCCRIVIKKSHTRIEELYINDLPVSLKQQVNEEISETSPQEFSIENAFHFITTVPLEKIEFIMEAAKLNSALSQEGQRKPYGLNISGTLTATVRQGLMSNDLLSKMLIQTVAASDARMGGAPVTAMSNFGSGNQGITATMPVVVLAAELKSSQEELIRALALSHLVAISVHARYTRLSALCAASTAAMGAAAGMAWLFTRDLNVIQATIINMVSDISGIICDGASNSCAMKVSSVTMSAFRSVLMAKQGTQVSSHDGIVSQDAEQTINNLSRLVNEAMPATDKKIIHIMTEKDALADS
ncbi:serine dehydratase subunit alpha family protein [Lonsdalea quercina]|uniref:L-cysteine desulfidase family protein n=1 Tax=Lonsdalea quercina TaxID=71657 RepID=UPI0039762903